VAEVLGQFLDGDAFGEHDTGVVVAQLVDALFAGGGVADAAALIFVRGGDDSGRERGPRALAARLASALTSLDGPFHRRLPRARNPEISTSSAGDCAGQSHIWVKRPSSRNSAKKNHAISMPGATTTVAAAS
jgi:hypothetical protein